MVFVKFNLGYSYTFFFHYQRRPSEQSLLLQWTFFGIALSLIQIPSHRVSPDGYVCATRPSQQR